MQQAVGLKRFAPSSKVGLRSGKLTWVHDIQPLELSDIYTIKLTYRLNRHPSVVVLNPNLEAPVQENQRLPHVYDDGSLCLYYARHHDWLPYMQLADTIVPWTSEWLAYYEVWVVTGEWTGGGTDLVTHRLDYSKP